MVKLSDLQVALLLEEIACAMRVGTPVIDVMRRLQSRRLGRIARAARQIAAGLERGESVSDAFRATTAPTRQQAAAAILAAKTSTDPALVERIAMQLRQRSSFASDTRIAWFYPWVLLVLGYVIAVLVMAPVIRRLHGPDLQWPTAVVTVAMWMESNWWVPPVVVVTLLVAFLVWAYSNKRFSRPARLGLFCNSLADQFVHDVPEDVAIRAAAEMSGEGALMGIAEPSLKSPAVARIVSSDGFPAGSNVGVGGKQTLIAQLRYLGSRHTERARHRCYIWSRVVPRCAMVVIGAGLTLSYAWWVIAPVYLQVAQW